MKVTIIGCGNMGRGIGTRLVAGGHDVELIDRNPADAQALAEELSKDGSATAVETNTLVPGEAHGQQLDVLIAGDDAGAKQKVAQLAESGGLRPIDVGPLQRARQLEHLGFLHISLQQPLGAGFASAVKFHW